MFRRSDSQVKPLPAEFLAWQVALRRDTMEKRHGSPHAGVAPIVLARRPGTTLEVASHSIICGLLPRADRLAGKTEEWRKLYESGIGEGARAVYDRGIEQMRSGYASPEDFDPVSITTLLPAKLPLADALRGDPRCALVFYVFDLVDRSEIGKLRCLHLDAVAEVLTGGPVFDNVYWHNALFHGPVDDHVVVHFRHLATWDTRFGALDPVAS
jgi:hypothetical protein